jgi:hypothetical protein
MSFSEIADAPRLPTSPAVEQSGLAANKTGSNIGRFLLHALLFLLAITPAAGPLLLIQKYGVNVAYWDEWNIVDAMIDAHHHVFPESLFSQHNEHRIVVPRLIYCALDNATGWNQFADMLAEFGVVCLTSLGILALIRSTVPGSRERPFAVYSLWFICNVLIFSIGQQENWLWAVGMMNVLPMAFIIGAMVVFRTRWRPWTRMIGCLLMATAATFSSGNGMLVWPLVGLLWVWSPSFSDLLKKRNLLLAWTIGGAVNLGLYFLHFFRPQNVADGYTNNIHKISFYAQVFLGNPFAPDSSMAHVPQSAIIGLALVFLLSLCAAASLYRTFIARDFQFSSSVLLWGNVAWFAIFSALMAGHSRGNGMPSQALASRYVTFSLYLPVAVLCLSVVVTSRMTGQSRFGIALTGLLSGAILVLQLQCLLPTLKTASASCDLRKRARAALTLINSLPDDDASVATLFPIPSYLRGQAKRANEIGFIQPALVADNHANKIVDPDRDHSVVGSLDTADTPGQSHFHAGGWAVLLRTKSVADAVFLTWDRNDDDPIIFAVAEAGLDRADVAQAMKDQRYRRSGWDVSCPLDRLPAASGPLRIRAWVMDLNTAKAVQIPSELQFRR